MRIIYTVGLPASGKTTWAKQYIRDNPGTKRVNKDELRAMIDGGKWSPKNEKDIIDIRDALIRRFLGDGHDVIVDDTNFNPKHIARFHEIAEFHDAVVVCQDFTTPLEECIRRDLERPNSVGERVIRKMYEQYLAPASLPMPLIEGAPYCIICDIDGTIAINVSGRSPYDMDRVGEDAANVTVRDILTRYHGQVHIILFSGRDAVARPLTEGWLSRFMVPYDELHFRADEDKRKDSIVKRELFDTYVRGKYNVLFVLDDRDQVVSMWRRELGLTCLQVNYGDF